MVVELSQEAPSTDNDPREHSLDEVIALYYGEWVLLKVTGFDEYHEPAKGLVLAHSPNRAATSEVLAREPPRSALPPDAPYQPYYTFMAYPFVHVGETLEQARARFADQRAAVEDARRAERRA